MTSSFHSSGPDTELPQLFRFLELMFRMNHSLGSLADHRFQQEYGVGVRDLMLVKHISDGALYPSDLAARLDMPRDMVSRSLERLVKAGIVERQIDPGDSRRTLLSVSSDAQEQRRVRQTFAELLRPAFVGIGDAERDAFLSTLARIADTLSEQKAAEKTGGHK